MRPRHADGTLRCLKARTGEKQDQSGCRRSLARGRPANRERVAPDRRTIDASLCKGRGSGVHAVASCSRTTQIDRRWAVRRGRWIIFAMRRLRPAHPILPIVRSAPVILSLLLSACGGSPVGPDDTKPEIVGISPNSGSTFGGTVVTITGRHFSAATRVTFGGVPATGVTVTDATTLMATTPSHAAGTVDVGAGDGSGGATSTLRSAFQFIVPRSPTHRRSSRA